MSAFTLPLPKKKYNNTIKINKFHCCIKQTSSCFGHQTLTMMQTTFTTFLPILSNILPHINLRTDLNSVKLKTFEMFSCSQQNIYFIWGLEEVIYKGLFTPTQILQSEANVLHLKEYLNVFYSINSVLVELIYFST